MDNGENENNNDYGVYVIFTRDLIESNVMVDKLLTLASKENDLLYCRSCVDKDSVQVNRFICCLRKTFYQDLSEKHNFKRDEEFNITKYRVDNHPLKTGTTYGFFVKSNQVEQVKIREIFEKFESAGFVREGSYSITSPSPYPNGNSRDYLIISFSKQNDKYPRQYIRKLKALLNNSDIFDRKIHINWVSNSVMSDVLSSAVKERKSK